MKFVDLSSVESQIERLVHLYVIIQGLEGDATTQLIEKYRLKSHTDLLDLVVPQSFTLSGRLVRDIDNFFCSVYALILKCDEKTQMKYISDFSTTIASNPDDCAALRLKFMHSLYQMFNGETRYNVFMNLLTLAMQSEQTEVLNSYITNIKPTISMLSADLNKQRDLYKKIISYLKNISNSEAEYEILCIYLKTFDENTCDEILETVTDQSARACALALMLPEVSTCDKLLDFKPVKFLQKHPKYSKIYDLLCIYVHQGVQEFDKFYVSNPQVFTNFELNHEQCQSQIRILSLATLANNSKEASFNEIATLLHVPVEEVEEWIISAISSSIITAKIDQLKQKVMFENAILRSADKDQWLTIKKKLAIWRQNISSIIQVIHTTSTNPNPALVAQ